MYYIVFGILYLISLLPLPVLYLLSYFFYFITYYVAGYRKEVVFKNIGIAFPEKSAAERKIIARRFYLHFWDNWIESLKLLSISKKALCRRVSGNLTDLEKVYASGRSCHVLLGHQFNWEWGNAYVKLKGVSMLCAYSPLSNKIFDRLLLQIRCRFGSIMLPFNDMGRAMLPYRNKQYLLALVADQSPPLPARSYWLDFFDTPTAFLKGPERGAILGNMPVVFVSLSKPSRGHYHLTATLLTDNAGDLRPGELTKRYAQQLQDSIKEQPSLYLWSHNRWKHRWKEMYSKMWVEERVA